MTNACDTNGKLIVFSQLLREPNVYQNHGLRAVHHHNSREMVLVSYDIQWTFLICYLAFLYSMVASYNFSPIKRKVPDPVFVSDDKVVQRSYRLEDFFWTGSGDGPIIEDSFNNDTETQENVIHEGPYETWRTTTVFHTTTILFATVYPKSPGCPAHGCKPHVSPVWTESVEFSSPVYPSTAVPDIMPSRTLPTTETSREKPSTTSSPLTFPATPKTLPPKATTATSRSSKEMKTSTSKSTSPTTPRSKPVDIPTTTKETTSSSKAPTTTTTAAAAKTKATTTSTTTTTTEPTTTTTSSTITTKKPIKKPSDPKREGNKPKDPTPSPKTDLEITEEPGSGFEGKTPPDQRYWILTVLKRDHYTPEIEINLIEDRLSSLYRKAFIRQQEKHLGINNSTLTSRQRRERRIPEPVRVHIHNVTRTISNDPNGVGLLYSVTVAGKPILALTAANDMRLLDIGEVSAELGFPVLTKAEPYLKGVVPTGARVKGRTRDTWLLIGSVVAAVSLLIILAALFTLGLSKKRSRRSASRGMTNRRHVFEGEEGSSNLAYQEDADLKSKSSSRRHHPKYEDAKAADGSGGTTVTFAEDQRRASTTSSSCSGSSEASLVRLRHQQRKKEQRKDSGDDKPRPRPRTRIRRVENADGTKDAHTYRASAQSASSAMSRDTYGGMTTEGFDEVEASPHKSRTPTSYLSMPSVKAFPRGARIPEPLSRVLEPISIRHLDADPDSKGVYPHKSRSQQQDYDNEYIHEARNKYVKGRGVARHGSLEGEDPGVIGPVVWDRHCQKINEIRQESLDPDEPDGGINIGKMRKRFNELLDDAFSMFGSRSGSPEDKEAKNGVISTRPSDNRVHSAIVRPVGHLLQESNLNTRPKTTDSRRPQTAMNKGPKGAWDSPNCRTPARPLSAGPFHKPSPVIDKNLILVDSDLSPSDPAVPLIAAIKDELKKFEYPLPGST